MVKIFNHTVSLCRYGEVLFTMNLFMFIILIYLIISVAFGFFLYLDTKETNISFYIFASLLWPAIFAVYVFLGFFNLVDKLITYVHERRMKK